MSLRMKIFVLLVTSWLALSACSGVQRESAVEPILSDELPSRTLDVADANIESSGDNQVDLLAEGDEVQDKLSKTPQPVFEQDYGPNEISERDYSDLEIITLLPKDGIQSIDAAEYYPLEEANREYSPEELVIGVEFNGDARAYAVSLLSRHEIVNDTVGGIKIAVTW